MITKGSGVVGTEVFTTAAEREPVVKLILRIGACTIPSAADIGTSGPITGIVKVSCRTRRIGKECIEGQEQFVVGELRCPVAPGVIDHSVSRNIRRGRRGGCVQAGVLRAHRGVVVIASAVLEVVAPVRIAARGSHVQRCEQGHAVRTVRVGGGVVIAVGTVHYAQLAIEVIVKLVGRKYAGVVEGHDIEEQPKGRVHVCGTFHNFVAENGDELSNLEVPTVTHRGADLDISLLEEEGVGVVVRVGGRTGGTVQEVGGIFTEHDVGAESRLRLVRRGQSLLDGDFRCIEVEVSTLCGVAAETAVDLRLVTRSGEVIAITGIDVAAEFHTLLGGLNEVILNHLFSILSGCFRGAVREGQAGHGCKHAKKGCNILDHFIYYLLRFVCCLVVFTRHRDCCQSTS